MPLAALVLARALASDSAAGLFQAGLAALVLGVVVAARPASPGDGAWGVGLLSVALASLGFAVIGGGLRGLLAMTMLMGGTALAAYGLSRLGVALGAPRFPAFAVACLVLFAAMLGLRWADPTSAFVERSGRRAFRQAVLHTDPATALAYDGAGFDRLRSPSVYFEVPLASSSYEVPAAPTTGGLWLGVGFVAGGAAWALTTRRRHEARA